MIVPTRNLILAKKVETEDKLASGLYAPPSVVDRWTAQQFEVIAVGPPAYYEEDVMLPRWQFQSEGWEFALQQTLSRGKKVLFYEKPDDIEVGSWIIVDWMGTQEVAPGQVIIRRDSVLAVVKEKV